MGDGFEVVTTELVRLAGDLKKVSTRTQETVGMLRLTPDTGGSSDETAAAFEQFATAADALAKRVGAFSENLQTTAANYSDADAAWNRNPGSPFSGDDPFIGHTP